MLIIGRPIYPDEVIFKIPFTEKEQEQLLLLYKRSYDAVENSNDITQFKDLAIILKNNHKYDSIIELINEWLKIRQIDNFYIESSSPFYDAEPYNKLYHICLKTIKTLSTIKEVYFYTAKIYCNVYDFKDILNIVSSIDTYQEQFDLIQNFFGLKPIKLAIYGNGNVW